MLFVFIILILLISFLLIEKSKVEFSVKQTFIIALVIRLFVTLFFLISRSEDLNSFIQFGAELLKGGKIYYALYFPFIGYLGMASLFFKNYLPPHIFLKLIFTIFDAMILFPLYYLCKKNRQSVLLFVLNPISFIVINIHGQMDSIPLFFFLLGMIFFLKKRILSSVLTISFAIYTKTWVALFILPLYRKLKKKALFIVIPVFLIVSVIVHTYLFRMAFKSVVEPIINYRGLYGWWGLSEMFKPLKLILPYDSYLDFQQLLRKVFLLSFIIYSLRFEFKDILKGITKLMLFFFTFSPTFGAQWLIWLVPFLLIIKPNYYKYFFITASIYLMVAFYGDAYQIPSAFSGLRDVLAHLTGIIVWLNVAFIFVRSKDYLKS